MRSIQGVDLFYGAAQALRGVSLEVPPGRVTCLLGRNGVGKTSLLRAIIGHLPIAAGSISWDGRGDLGPRAGRNAPAAAWPTCRRAARSSRCLSVRENLETGFAPLPRGRSGRSPTRSSSSSRCCGTCCGGAAAISPAASSSSLAIARALVIHGPACSSSTSRPRASSRRSSRTSRRSSNILRDQVASLAILLVEQYFDFAHRLGDGFAVMDRGAVALAGEMAEADPMRIKQLLTV